jgi:hypothetical protein
MARCKTQPRRREVGRCRGPLRTASGPCRRAQPREPQWQAKFHNLSNEGRSYSAIGGSEIDRAREKFLSQPGADREQIEKEYLDAKARLAAAERACVDWNYRAGVAPLREQYERANDAWREAVMRMARTKPVTPAGAAALIDYARRDIDIGGPPPLSDLQKC